MHPDSEYGLSSSCSTASPGGDTPACSQLSPDWLCSTSSMDTKKDTVTSAPESFVPTVTAISTSPDLKWMVQPTVIASISPSPRRSKAKAHIISTASSSSKEGGHKATPVNRKGQKDQPSKEEEERRRIRRERNKIAAAKCRNRRRELTDTLQVETDQLEEEKAALQNEIADLLKEKEQLEQILSSHKPTCKLPSVSDEDDVEGDHVMQQDPPSSPQLLSLVGGDKSSEGIAALVESPVMQDVDPLPITISTTAILGNSNILLCSSAEEEPLEDLKGDDLDDLVPSLEMVVNDEVAAASVPDIDLGGPFCLSDWETLYKSVANDLESLSTPLPSSSPSCSNYRSAFSFNYSEIDSLAEGCETLKGGHGTSEFTKDSINSPTLLAL